MSVTPAIGASTIAGLRVTSPIRNSFGIATSHHSSNGHGTFRRAGQEREDVAKSGDTAR